MRKLLLWLPLLVCFAASLAAHEVSGTVNVVLKGDKKKDDLSTVVIYLDQVKDATTGSQVAPKKDYTMETRNKQLTPRVMVVPVGASVNFPNFDPIFHNLFSVSRPNDFDLGLYKGGTSMTKLFSVPGIVRVYCNVHPQMSATIVVANSPYFTTAERSGNFSLGSIPNGSYILRAYTDEGQSDQRIDVVDTPLKVMLNIDAKNFKKINHKNKLEKTIQQTKMKDTKPGLSLSFKFFLLTAIIIVLLIGVTLVFSQKKATNLANETIRDGLEETLSTFDSFQADRYSKLKMINNVIAQNPYIIAYVQQADTPSILDQARQRQQELHSDFIIVTDDEGTILARTDKPTSSGQSLAQIPLIAKSLEGEEVSGLWIEGGNLYNAVVLPLVQQDTLVACLAVGYAINDTFAGEIKNLTHSETAIFLTPEKGTPSLIASTQSSMKSDLTAAITANISRSDPFLFHVGPESYIGALRQLKNLQGHTLGNFLAFRSLDRELYGFRQFQKNILIVGVGVMVFAFLVSFLGAQRITGPLRHLTDVINEVKEGNYDVNIDVKSKDEVGILANSFQRLLAELKEKAQLVQYLSTQPSMTSAVTSTLGPTVMNSPNQQATLGTNGSAVTGGNTLAQLTAGSVIANRYEVQSVLGAGGMGVVLKAHDRQLDEVVALKMLRNEVFTQDPAALERFKQELKLARRITHRHVVRTYDYSELDNYYVISMEYVKGITLKQLVRQRGMLPLKIGLQIGKQICSALDAAHEKGVVHRDIKPQNILLESSGDVKIMDFGIARVADMKGMTSTGTVMGTPDYMSPEQAQGLEMDLRTDVYSTGVVLFEIFTGKLPFIAESALAVLNKHVREQPPRPASMNPNIPPELERILLKALAKSPDQRYQRIQELYDDLDRVSAMLARPAVA